MGIDRKDVRIVCHYNIPKSMASFYQESGRAGRDQLPSRSLLYYGLDDKRRMEFILKNTKTKGHTMKPHDGKSEKALEDFAQMVAYCENSGCRRKKILESFGEKVSTSLCGKTCDACKHPNLTIANLEELSHSQGRFSKSGFRPIIMNSSFRVAEESKTEFWNHDDEEDYPDDDILNSDEDTLEHNDEPTAKHLSSQMGLSDKVECLLRAEEAQNCKNSKKQRCEANGKQVILQTLRDASTQRLSNALKQAAGRLGKHISELQEISIFLENDCYKKYGKVGKSFYNSQVASTIRWLSATTSSELTRLQSRSSKRVDDLTTMAPSKSASLSHFPDTSYNYQPENSLEMGTDLECSYSSGIATEQHTEKAHSPVHSHLKFVGFREKNVQLSSTQSSSQALFMADSARSATSEHDRNLFAVRKTHEEGGASSVSASKSTETVELPPIPSFSDFVNRKEKIGKSDCSVPSEKKHSWRGQSDKESRNQGRKDAEKRIKLN